MLDYCPFCGGTELVISTVLHSIGYCSQVKCGHCGARGGSYVDETEEESIEKAVGDWNQKDIRPNTICHRIPRFFSQVTYDLECLWYKIRHWDW